MVPKSPTKIKQNDAIETLWLWLAALDLLKDGLTRLSGEQSGSWAQGYKGESGMRLSDER
jgi:hypothetical protein